MPLPQRWFSFPTENINTINYTCPDVRSAMLVKAVRVVQLDTEFVLGAFQKHIWAL